MNRRAAVGPALATTLGALAYDPLAEAAEPKRALGLALCACGVALWIARPTRSPVPEWGARAALGFLGISALSLCWGLPAGTRDLSTLCAALGVGLLASALGPRDARHAARLCALGLGGVSASLVVSSALRGATPAELHAGQGNPNWLGLLLAVTLPLSLDAARVFRRAAPSWRVLVFAACLVQLPALYLSHSRVAWLAASLASVGFLLLTTPRRSYRVLLLLPLLAALLGVAASNPGSTGDVPFDRALGGRAWIWQHSARAAWHAFPLGAGLGRFGHAYLDAQGEALAELKPGQAARRFTNATTAHNDYLQAAAESGPFAALLLGGALILGACAHARRRWLGGAAALAACAVTALADSPLRQPGIVLLVGLLLGVPLRARVPAPRRVAPTLLALGALAVTALLARDALRGWLGTRERTLARDAEPRQQIAHLLRSARLDPSSGETQLELGLARLRLGDARGASAALGRADAAFADTGARIAIGQAELELSRTAAAGHAFERALAWNFGSFRARLGLSQVRLREQRLDDAEREALTAYKLLPGDPRGRELLDAIREAKMDR